jgi:hypothetical protein
MATRGEKGARRVKLFFLFLEVFKRGRKDSNKG